MKKSIGFIVLLVVSACSSPNKSDNKPQAPSHILHINSSASNLYLNSGGSFGVLAHLVQGWLNKDADLMAPAFTNENKLSADVHIQKLENYRLIGFDYGTLEKNSHALQTIREATFTYIVEPDTITKQTDIEIYWENGKYDRWVTYFNIGDFITKNQ